MFLLLSEMQKSHAAVFSRYILIKGDICQQMCGSAGRNLSTLSGFETDLHLCKGEFYDPSNIKHAHAANDGIHLFIYWSVSRSECSWSNIQPPLHELTRKNVQTSRREFQSIVALETICKDENRMRKMKRLKRLRWHGPYMFQWNLEVTSWLSYLTDAAASRPKTFLTALLLLLLCSSVTVSIYV